MKTIAALTLCILATMAARDGMAASIGSALGTLLSYQGTNILPRSSLDAGDFGWDGTNITVKSTFDGDMNCNPLVAVHSQTDCNGCDTHYSDGAIGVPNGVIYYGCSSNTPAVGDIKCSNEVWIVEQLQASESGGFYSGAEHRFLRYVCREWDGDSWEVIDNIDIDGQVNIHGNLILIDGLGTNIISAGARGNILMGTNNGTIYLGPQSHGNIVQARIGSRSMLTIGTNCNVNKIAAWIDGGSGETLMVVNGSSGNTITHRSADEASRLDNSSYNYVDASDTFLTNCSYNVIVASSTQTNGLFSAVVGSKLGLPGATVDGIDTTLSSSSSKIPTSAAVVAATNALSDRIDSAIGDNLGNHTATQSLLMASRSIAQLGDGGIGTDEETPTVLTLSEGVALVDGFPLATEAVLVAATNALSDRIDSAIGDNLGNHLATLGLDLNGNAVSGATQVAFLDGSLIRENTENPDTLGLEFRGWSNTGGVTTVLMTNEMLRVKFVDSEEYRVRGTNIFDLISASGDGGVLETQLVAYTAAQIAGSNSALWTAAGAAFAPSNVQYAVLAVTQSIAWAYNTIYTLTYDETLSVYNGMILSNAYFVPPQDGVYGWSVVTLSTNWPTATLQKNYILDVSGCATGSASYRVFEPLAPAAYSTVPLSATCPTMWTYCTTNDRPYVRWQHYGATGILYGTAYRAGQVMVWRVK